MSSRSPVWWLRQASRVAFVLCLHKPVIGAGVALSLNSGLLSANEFAVVAWKPALTSTILALVAASLIDVRSSPLTDSFAWLMLSGSAAFSNRAFRDAGIESYPIEALLPPVLVWHIVCLIRARREGHRPRVFASALAAGTLAAVVAVGPYYVLPRDLWTSWPPSIAIPVLHLGLVGSGLYATLRLRRLRILAFYTLAALILAGLYLGVMNERPRSHSRYALHGSWPGAGCLRDGSIRQQRDREHHCPARHPEAREEQVRGEPEDVGEPALLEVLRSEPQRPEAGIQDGHRV